MDRLSYKDEYINIFWYDEAEKLIMQLSDLYAGDVTVVSRGGRGRNKIEYYNYPCSFDIETTTIKPGELDYPYAKDAPPIAFPYLFQFNIYGYVIMCRQYREALDIFGWLVKYFRTGGNRRLVLFDHNLGYEEHFFRSLYEVNEDGCFALDDHHPVTIITADGLMFRDSYKMSNMSLETLTKDWSDHWIKNKEIMDYSQLRTPYTPLDDNTLIYSALDVLSLSDAIEKFLAARNEKIWTKCPTSTSFIRQELKKTIGVSAKKRTKEQLNYFKILEKQKITKDIYMMLTREARGGNTHANRAITGKLLRSLAHFDIVSSYPAQMVGYPEYPLGEWVPLDPGSWPEEIELFERNGYCCLFDIALMNPRLKKGVTVPYISISKMTIIYGSGMNATDNGRYISGLDAIRLTLFGAEWEIVKKQYDYDDAVILSGYFAKKGYLPDILRRFVLDLYAQKTELKGIPDKAVEYALAKTYVNGVFGMAYTNPVRDLYKVTNEGIILEDKKDIAETLEEYQNSISYFLPYAWGAMVACLGRVYLQKMIDAVGENFCYCDTDSVFALDPEGSREKIRQLEKELTEKQRQCGMQLSYNDIKGRPHELGAIDEEPIAEYFKTFGAKKYITVEEGQLHCTVAGVPKIKGAEIIGSPENFNIGLNFPGAITGKNCLWYNPDPNMTLHDKEGRPIEVHYNIAMLPVDYLLSLSYDYMECLSIEGNFHWNFKEADKNTINEEDII